MLDQIDRICFNKVVKQERAAMDVYEVNLKKDLNVIQIDLMDDIP